MNLIDFLNSPWAILPDRLLEMQTIYATHLRGEKIDVKAIEARIGRPLASDQQDYTLREGGVAVLPIAGVLAPKMNLFMQISGGASTQILAKQVASMQADPRVRAVVLAIDSPGGSVLGTPALAEAVRALAADKPTVAVSEGTMASAAYWIGSAANAVYIEGLTDLVGSIGVVATHDYEPRAGRVRTDVTAGRYKRMASSDAPLTEEGRAYLQQMVDENYRVFVNTVAANRGVSADTVLERMADGRVFVGQQAIDAGLVDGVATLEALVDQLATTPQRFAQRSRARVRGAALSAVSDNSAADALSPPADGPVVAASTTPAEGAPAMSDTNASATPTPGAAAAAPATSTAATPAATLADLERAHPTLAAELRAAGATAERERIQCVMAQSMPGHEALVQRLAFDGHTTGPEAAVAVLQAHRQAAAGAAAAHAADAPQAAPASAAPEGEGKKTREQQVAEARQVAARDGIDFVAAMKRLGHAA